MNSHNLYEMDWTKKSLATFLLPLKSIYQVLAVQILHFEIGPSYTPTKKVQHLLITYDALGTRYTNMFYIFSFNPKPLCEVLSPFSEDKTEMELRAFHSISNVDESYS